MLNLGKSSPLEVGTQKNGSATIRIENACNPHIYIYLYLYLYYIHLMYHIFYMYIL